MHSPGVVPEERVDRWWFWFAVALFLLLPLDLFTTLLAVGIYGTGVEANPIMRWLLRQGLLAVTVANLAVVGLVVSLFHVAVDRVQRVPPAYRSKVDPAISAWIGFLILAGLVLVANNVLVLV
jgi:hypothetical protein